ncbi:MAG: GNAT family N-acetyltransferase [Bacteroidia bacterium]|nr:GNAT family N-acetyltransferase [Bacteroidia bacterium]
MKKNYTTERLLLSELTLKDTEFIIELVNTEGWLKFIGNRNIKTKEDAIKYIQMLLDDPGIVYWVVKSKEQNIQIGVVTFISRKHLPHPDLGFAFLPQHSGKGYAFEAATIVLNDIIKEHPTLLASTLDGNISSMKLLEKLGFTPLKEELEENIKVFYYSITLDKLSIDANIKTFFGIFNNKNNQQANWDPINKVCMPETMIIKKNKNERVIYNLNSFIEPRKKILSDGTLVDFEEKEISSETKIVNNIAQRYSRYQKNGILNGKPFNECGTKFFQFIKTNNEWKISSIIWEDDNI